jgi:hypothetical protein
MRLPDPDEEALPVMFDLLENEGLLLGGSSAINVAGAMRLARDLGPGHTIVTVLCDGGARYASKLYNPAFLREKGLPVPAWMELRHLTSRVSAEAQHRPETGREEEHDENRGRDGGSGLAHHGLERLGRLLSCLRRTRCPPRITN